MRETSGVVRAGIGPYDTDLHKESVLMDDLDAHLSWSRQEETKGDYEY